MAVDLNDGFVYIDAALVVGQYFNIRPRRRKLDAAISRLNTTAGIIAVNHIT